MTRTPPCAPAPERTDTGVAIGEPALRRPEQFTASRWHVEIDGKSLERDRIAQGGVDQPDCRPTPLVWDASDLRGPPVPWMEAELLTDVAKQVE